MTLPTDRLSDLNDDILKLGGNNVLPYKQERLKSGRMATSSERSARIVELFDSERFPHPAKSSEIDLNALSAQLDQIRADVDSLTLESQTRLDWSHENTKTVRNETARIIRKSFFSLLTEILPAFGLCLTFILAILSVINFSNEKIGFSALYALLTMTMIYPTYMTFVIRGRFRKEI